MKYNVDPQEEAMVRGNIDDSIEQEKWHGTLTYNDMAAKQAGTKQRKIPTIQGRWRTYYENVYDVLCNNVSPLISYESVINTMTVLDAALQSVKKSQAILLPQHTKTTS